MAYTLIASQTLLNPTASVTFSGIPGIYKDLVLECFAGLTVNDASFYVQFNGDTGNNYSITCVRGDGTSATSYRASNSGVAALGYYVTPNTSLDSIFITNIMSYSNTNINKTLISRASRGSSGTYAGSEAVVSLWRNTAAINSMRINTSSVNLISGSIFKLWGVS